MGTQSRDLSHHLSKEALQRKQNPMKAVWKIGRAAASQNPSFISLANGDPHWSLYPISQIDFRVPSLNVDDPVNSWRDLTNPGQTLSVYRDEPCTLNLKVALQYGAGAGLTEIRDVLHKFNDALFAPSASAEHQVTMSLGNADALTKCFRLLGDPGDAFLVEEFSYPGMTNAPLAHGIRWVPVAIDENGLKPNILEEILQNWNETTQGRRPHVLYTIPCGQNPTGSTLPLERRRQIYDLAWKWDFVIIEDDPYYYLQYDLPSIESKDQDYVKNFASQLIPTFLSLDMEGRVLRIDSFSKIIVPGLRLGWITSNPLFAQKLESFTDSSTQHPHGIGQAFVAELLSGTSPDNWGFTGFLKWVRSLSDDYQRRRDLFIDLFSREIGDCDIARISAPRAGMFFWIEIKLAKHPQFKQVLASSFQSNTLELMDELFKRVLDAGLLVMPASTFAIEDRDLRSITSQTHIHDRCNHIRVSFATTDEVIRTGVTTLVSELKRFFDVYP